MNCTKCQKAVPDDATFCCYCGKKLVKKPSSRVKARGNGTGTAFPVPVEDLYRAGHRSDLGEGGLRLESDVRRAGGVQ